MATKRRTFKKIVDSCLDIPTKCLIEGKVTVINTANVANIGIFEIGNNWDIFIERLEQFFLANRVEGRRAADLLTSINEDVIRCLEMFVIYLNLVPKHLII